MAAQVLNHLIKVLQTFQHIQDILDSSYAHWKNGERFW